jgi:hypothetical protein
VEHKINGVGFATTLFGSHPHVSRNFAFSESQSGKAWVRTKHYRLYNTGEFYDVWNDVMERKPLKDVSGSAAQSHELLKAAFSKLNYPNKNN